MKRSLVALLLVAMILTSCSGFKRRMADNIADALTSGNSSVFTGDDDPEFIASALPFGLKIYESLIESNNDHKGLYLTTAAGYASYAYAFCTFPADTLPLEREDEAAHLKQRGKKLFLRGRDYAIKGLELSHPNFIKNLTSNSDSLLPTLTEEDIDLMYWAGLSWLGAFTADKFDMKLALSFQSAKKLLFRVKEIDSEYGGGAIDNFLITYYGGTPASMGGSLDSAEYYYNRVQKVQKIPSADPHISYARTVLVQRGDREEFRRVVKKASKIKPKADPKNALVRTIKQIEAKWLLNHEDDFFIE